MCSSYIALYARFIADLLNKTIKYTFAFIEESFPVKIPNSLLQLQRIQN